MVPIESSRSNRIYSSLNVSSSSNSNAPHYIKAKDLGKAKFDESVIMKGWVRTVRKQKTLAFVEINDGSNLKGVQCVLLFDSIDDDTKQVL